MLRWAEPGEPAGWVAHLLATSPVGDDFAEELSSHRSRGRLQTPIAVLGARVLLVAVVRARQHPGRSAGHTVVVAPAKGGIVTASVVAPGGGFAGRRGSPRAGLAQGGSAQSAQIDAVSGATFTSRGYVRSLQAALDSV